MADDKTYEDQVVYLTDLLDRARPGPTVLDGFTFRRCVLRGPAVLWMLHDIVMEGCTFNVPNAEVMLFTVQADDPGDKTGIVGVQNTNFIESTMENIAFCGYAEQLQSFRQTPRV